MGRENGKKGRRGEGEGGRSRRAGKWDGGCCCCSTACPLSSPHFITPPLPGSQQVKPCTRCCYCRDQPCCWWGKSALSVPHFSRRHNNLVVTPGQPSGLATALSLISTGVTLLETPPLWYDTAMSLPAEEAFVTLFNRLGEGNLDLLDVPSDDGDIVAIGCGHTGGIGSRGRLADEGCLGAALPDKECIDGPGGGDKGKRPVGISQVSHLCPQIGVHR